MKTKALLVFWLIAFPAVVFSEPRVIQLFMEGPIHPITAEYILGGVDGAEKSGAAAVVIQVQTPGGLEASMRTIISRMINSSVPVIVYVAPSGSRATSAGFFITIAADLAVMAPGTHLGSAHPVFGQDAGDSENVKTMMKKATEDSVAYIKTLAEKRGRNVEQAEKAVRESISFTENEALKFDLIDFVAADMTELLKKADGMEIRRFQGEALTLKLAGAKVEPVHMTRRQSFLSMLADPNIAFFLIGLGSLGLMVELYNPGLILPGIVGVICMALFFLSVQILPINYTGLLLIIFGIILFVLELKVQSYGALTIGGLVSLALGATMLVDAPIPEMRIAMRAIATVVILAALTMGFLMAMVISLHRKQPLTGVQGIMQETGIAQTDIDPDGQVFVRGCLWRAVSPEKIDKGEQVKIVSIEGLTLHVKKRDGTGV